MPPLSRSPGTGSCRGCRQKRLLRWQDRRAAHQRPCPSGCGVWRGYSHRSLPLLRPLVASPLRRFSAKSGSKWRDPYCPGIQTSLRTWETTPARRESTGESFRRSPPSGLWWTRLRSRSGRGTSPFRLSASGPRSWPTCDAILRNPLTTYLRGFERIGERIGSPERHGSALSVSECSARAWEVG